MTKQWKKGMILLYILILFMQPVVAEAKNPYKESDVRLLSSIIYAEAGNQPYAGKLAVGIVVVNRKNSKKFPNSIKSVIYQKSQFGPVKNGSLNRALRLYDKKKLNKDCIKAAKKALSGTKKVTYKKKTINLKNCLYFSGRVKGYKYQISGHQFK